MNACPCEGRSYNWHYRNDVPICNDAKVERKAKEKRRPTKDNPRWTPGSSILVPEFDPL